MKSLPLDLPVLSAGYAALTPAARSAAAAIAVDAARALASATSHPVRIAAAARPAVAGPLPGAGMVRLPLTLAALPCAAALDVDARLAARAVDLLAGGPGDVAGGLELTPVEHAALELLALHALDGAADATARLAPRLERGGAAVPAGALVVDLELRVGPVRGPARLLVPAAAIAALALPPAPVDAARALELPVAVRSGRAVLSEAELAALAPGDAVVVEPGGDALVLPGGLAIAGELAGDQLTVKEWHMNEWTGSFPVALAVELGRTSLSLAALGALEPGAVVPLPIRRTGEVVLRAGERAVARGQLVEVDGALAVRIDALEVQP